MFLILMDFILKTFGILNHKFRELISITYFQNSTWVGRVVTMRLNATMAISWINDAVTITSLDVLVFHPVILIVCMKKISAIL